MTLPQNLPRVSTRPNSCVLGHSLRTIWTIVCVATAFAVLWFGADIAAHALMNRVAPVRSAELTAEPWPTPRVPTLCAYVGEAARDACDQQQADDRGVLVEACSMPSSDPRICADMVTRVVYKQQQVSSSNLACVASDCSHVAPFCPGYDPRLPAPDTCPPGTPMSSDPQRTGN
jgi:hypothetical protein